MYGAFREKPSVLSKDEIIEKFIYWQDKLIGKAKLVPGKHHLLFGPFTVRYIYRLLSQYENRRNQDLVNELRLELLKHLEGAGGLPGHVKEFVRRHIANKKAVSTLTRYVRSISEGNYHKKLWNFQNEHPSGLERKIASELPFGWGKTAEGGGPVETVAPWNWDELDEDTG
jgi:hypothetical protein